MLSLHFVISGDLMYALLLCSCADEISYEMIKELILNQTVRANLALLIVAGLPFSGKSTVLRKLVNSSGESYQLLSCVWDV